MSSTIVPPELADKIIDFLWDSKPDLCTCSLVCKAWLPSSHLFESISFKPDRQFLALSRVPVVASYTQVLDLRSWPLEINNGVLPLLDHLSDASRLRKLILGSFPPLPEHLPTLPQLEMAWLSWGDGLDSAYPHVGVKLEHLAIQGLHRNADILRWLECSEHAPHTKRFSLQIPNTIDAACLELISKYLHQLDGHLECLPLDIYPSLSLRRNITLLALEGLTSLRRLHIGHGIYFHPPAPSFAGSCRIFPTILGIVFLLTPRNRLEELVLDVDISPDAWVSDSEADFQKILDSPAVREIRTVQFNLPHGPDDAGISGRTYGVRFAAFMREKGLIFREAVYADESKGNFV
ncbi:hypothetical protein B0H16DRAFT_1729888 [Mycena metata]|uniref:F-box domain-containing protein n=1 Tax=Mycena metata TaxID=1033252 RepID=A0AAD7I9W7_9AGAR|nr:hypothetical protein B0H16DRAFT_1729888 [Mycena metata]